VTIKRTSTTTSRRVTARRRMLCCKNVKKFRARAAQEQFGAGAAKIGVELEPKK